MEDTIRIKANIFRQHIHLKWIIGFFHQLTEARTSNLRSAEHVYSRQVRGEQQLNTELHRSTESVNYLHPLHIITPDPFRSGSRMQPEYRGSSQGRFHCWLKYIISSWGGWNRRRLHLSFRFRREKWKHCSAVELELVLEPSHSWNSKKCLC